MAFLKYMSSPNTQQWLQDSSFLDVGLQDDVW